MTSPEAVRRAKSHKWVEVNDQTEHCVFCKITLPKDTDLEDVPECKHLEVTKR